jgi:hypothetical protein
MRKLIVALSLAVAVTLVSAIAALSAMSPELSAKLTAKAETPDGPAGGHGIVNITLKPGVGKVCWSFSDVGKIGTAQAAHIHKGRAGVSGPVVVALGAKYLKKGCAAAAKATIKAIQAKPNAFYVNVHTAKYPAGAIRGQLVVGMMSM